MDETGISFLEELYELVQMKGQDPYLGKEKLLEYVMKLDEKTIGRASTNMIEELYSFAVQKLIEEAKGNSIRRDAILQLKGLKSSSRLIRTFV